MTEYRITAGFIPLTDSLLLVMAREKGFAAAQGVDLTLVREISWANIRDRVAVGQFDVAQMLAPMPIAASLGLSPIDVPVLAVMGLGLGGNAVTVSARLWANMIAAGSPQDYAPDKVGAALAKVVRGSGSRLKLAVVHPYSSHNYELRYWLAASGIHPDRDVEIVIVPPPLMADALTAGRIDGYCVGEPWGSVAVASGAGRMATVKAALWPASPEKVLGVTAAWAEANGEALAALIRALHQAARWCSNPLNHAEAANVLSQAGYLGQPAEVIARALSGQIAQGPDHVVPVEDFFIPHARAANLPNPEDALWYYSQMVRWGGVPASAASAATAAASYRPDIYRAALAPLGAEVPEPTRGAWFDGVRFDAEAVDSYVTELKRRDLLIS
jgi:NitT/TauT family transport system ATP-binding protein